MFRALKKSGLWRRWSHYRAFVRDDDESHWRDGDSEKNSAGSLASDEGVQLAAVWVTELYTPSQINGLFEGIARLGWEHGKSRDESVLAWASDVRQGRNAGWTNLGLVTSTPHFASERVAELPHGVRAAFPVLMSLTPSITALVIGFHVDDETSNALDRPLRAAYSTLTENGRGMRWWNIALYVLFNKNIRFSRTIHDPSSQRRRSVANCVSQVETECTDWVRRNLPGVFSSGLREGLFPTATLLVTEVVNPATENLRHIGAFEGLRIDRDYDAWVSDQWPCARLVLPGVRDGDGLRLTFSCRRRDAFPEAPGFHDPTSNWTIAYRAGDMIRELLSRWALTAMLDGYHEQLSGLRDKSAAARSYQPIGDLKQLRSLIRTRLYDMDLSVHEVIKFASDVWYRHNVLSMRRMGSSSASGPDLVDGLQNAQHQRATQISRESELLKSVLSLSSDISQTITNLRIQRFVVVLTVVSIGIAIASLYVSVHPLK
ncbi:hypothetical protein [Ralstonia solanacearum]|uniref:hypothetical protein n=1 Tax=Ralstonia solanacearum TaxID=305 RepID=UPI0012D3FD5A|nr:hypothetical protein [Ralstonia solanacearum]MDB0534810.1 hypothetical protein [Ralstonia solanacearum]MDB0538247.1 hypothetical protein [Ralstonia solanacearum]MDB0548155.1 hypothetical protein [Ralstonia solanacearum]MDC6189851.1 hypothetical protein [Ralstonia solanacearum]MDD7808012.1 hypothetical protein [Ralstonia solanacearum]